MGFGSEARKTYALSHSPRP